LLAACCNWSGIHKEKEIETEGNDAPAPKQRSFDCLWCGGTEVSVDVPFFGLVVQSD
jgi:hypothetical protein